MVKSVTRFRNLTDEELLLQADSDRAGDPLVEEICQRLEKYADWAASLSAIEVTQHRCPECNHALLAHYDAEENELTIERVPK